MFRFTIRDVLWLTALCSLAVAWLLDRGKLSSDLRQANSGIGSLNNRVIQLMSGPDWAANDRLMDGYEARWDFIRRREQELGISPTDAPEYGDPNNVSPNK